MRRKLLSILALLCLTVSSAWADEWDGATYTATGDETLDGPIIVNADAVLTIKPGVTVTVNDGIIVADGITLIITGGGTLKVFGTDGASDCPGGNAVEGNVIIYGAEVIAYGGTGGYGSDGDPGSPGADGAPGQDSDDPNYPGDDGDPGEDGDSGEFGCDGSCGGDAFTGQVIVISGSVYAYGGNGGDGGLGGDGGDGGFGGAGGAPYYDDSIDEYIGEPGNEGEQGCGGDGGEGGKGGDGGYAFRGNLIFYGGEVHANGGIGGSEGAGGDGGAGLFPGNGGSPGCIGFDGDAFLYDIVFQVDPASVTTYPDDVIIQATDNHYVDITAADAPFPGAIIPEVDSGYCGDPSVNSGEDVTWSLNCLDNFGVMTISGTGAMADFDYDDVNNCTTAPWFDSYNDAITSVVITDGITSIGNFAFFGCENLESVTMGKDVESIGIISFLNCSKLTTINFGSSVRTIGNQAFSFCPALTSVTLPASVTSIGSNAFNYCSNLATVTLNSNPFIDVMAFPASAAVTMNLTANAAGGAKWSTFYNKLYNFEADGNTQVYKAELSGTTLTLHEVTDKIVDAGVGVVLETTGGGDPVMTLTTSASSNTDANSLDGVSDAAGLTADNPSTTFVLNYTAAYGVGFYKLTSGYTLGVGKAYVTYSGALAPEFLFFEEDSADGIVSPLGETEEGGGAIFNLAGQRIQKMQRGINIVNGKKIIK